MIPAEDVFMLALERHSTSLTDYQNLEILVVAGSRGKKRSAVQ